MSELGRSAHQGVAIAVRTSAETGGTRVAIRRGKISEKSLKVFGARVETSLAADPEWTGSPNSEGEQTDGATA
jgi:hypothetical protein